MFIRYKTEKRDYKLIGYIAKWNEDTEYKTRLSTIIMYANWKECSASQ